MRKEDYIKIPPLLVCPVKGVHINHCESFFEPVGLFFRKVSFCFHILIEPLGILGLLQRRMVVVSHRCLRPHS